MIMEFSDLYQKTYELENFYRVYVFSLNIPRECIISASVVGARILTKSSWLKTLGLKCPVLKCLLFWWLEDISTPDFSTQDFSTPWFRNSWLKSLGLKGLGLKLDVEKSGVKISFNLHEYGNYSLQCCFSFSWLVMLKAMLDFEF